MIERILDAGAVNAIANEATVRQMMFVGMMYPLHDLDFSDCMENKQNVCLMDEKGFCSIFQWSAPGVYECHIMAPKTARGASCMASAREMLTYMRNAARDWYGGAHQSTIVPPYALSAEWA